MESIQQILGWFTSGDGRAVAAAVLFTVMLIVKRVAFVKKWLELDTGWFTRPRKKLFVTALFAMAPAIAMLPDDSVQMKAIVETAAWAFFGAMGLHSGAKALSGKRAALIAALLGTQPVASPAAAVEEDPDEVEDD